jgi:hypothetical protein
MWFRPNLASPGAALWEENIIVFVCGLDQTSIHRELLHEKSTSSSLYVGKTKPRFIGSCYSRRQHHRLCGLDQTSLHREQLHEKKTPSSLNVVLTKPASLGAATWGENIIVSVCGLDQTNLTGSSYMRRKHHRLCMWFRPNPPHWEQLYEKKTSSSLYVV